MWSEGTFAELESPLWKPKFDRYLGLDDRRSFLCDARAIGAWVGIHTQFAQQPNSGDPTNDQDLLPKPPIPGLKIFTPAQALALA